MLYSHTDPQYVPYLKPSQDEDSYINASFIDVRNNHHLCSLYVLGAVFFIGIQVSQSLHSNTGSNAEYSV